MLSLVCRSAIGRLSSRPVFSSQPFRPNFFKTLNITKRVNLSTGSGPHELPDKARKIVGWWCMTCAGMTFTTVVVGGITRLTNSGLSMVDWHPFKEFPPLTATAWEQEFEKYKQFPEYKIRNKNMTLEEFKWIWYMEYFHRSIGRAIGAVFFIPATIFWYKGWFKGIMRPRVIRLGVLLVAQGLMGWYMVKSGLEEKKEYQRDPKVSHLRLASHLALAFVFYGFLFWSGLEHLSKPSQIEKSLKLIKFRTYGHLVKGLLFFTAFSGALVAGLDAGLVYNSWPKMADRWIPTDILSISPKWKNFFNNATTVQFDHRMFGYATFCAVTALWHFSRKLPLAPRARLAANCLMLVTLAQVSLGILNILLYVPKPLASAHQAGSLTAISVAFWLGHELKLMKAIKSLPK